MYSVGERLVSLCLNEEHVVRKRIRRVTVI